MVDLAGTMQCLAFMLPSMFILLYTCANVHTGLCHCNDCLIFRQDLNRSGNVLVNDILVEL